MSTTKWIEQSINSNQEMFKPFNPFERKQLAYQALLKPETSEQVPVIIHYHREDASYQDWDLWVWEVGDESSVRSVSFEFNDEFGAYARFDATLWKEIGYVIRKKDWSARNHSNDQYLNINRHNEIWVYEGQDGEGVVPLHATQTQLVIHYYRYQNDYDRWNVWGWANTLKPFGLYFHKQDDFGSVVRLNLSRAMLENNSGIDFIVRRGEWECRDVDLTRWISFEKPKNNTTPHLQHVYLIEGDATVYTEPPINKTPKLKGTTFTDINQLKTMAYVPFNQTEEIMVTTTSGEVLPILETRYSDDSRWVYLTLETKIHLGQDYFITINGFEPLKRIQYFGLYDSDFFKAYHYEGDDLGITYSKKQTTFKVWAPTASNLHLKLYQTGDGETLLHYYKMNRSHSGLWTLTLSGDLNGLYYTYEVSVEGLVNETVDPYAKATGVNGQRGMILDLSQTNPPHWDETHAPVFSGHITDAILYEAHLRDLSSSPTSGSCYPGKYLHLTETNTKNAEGLSTGLGHLKELGITHLHLLPLFDYLSVDETKLDHPHFNWGYDPHHYNVPEGSYSTDPYNGDVRIKEFKQMVQALHQNNIRVVMDMVYNHTAASTNSPFNQLVPGYFYRLHGDGSFSNGSGCGNEFASERYMARKFIKDSLCHWAKEYQIKGFRFDLMALHDIQTLNEIKEALHQIDPTIILYGEGWTGGDSLLPYHYGAFKANASYTPGISYFNDGLRDAIKGDVGNKFEAGLINGNHSWDCYDKLKAGIVGGILHDQVPGWQTWACHPGQSVAYVSAHDNHTLFDKLYEVEIGACRGFDLDCLKQLQKQANAIVLTSQGVPFLHSGVEMLRSKGGDHNSYCSPDVINQLDWTLKSEFMDVVQYYQGLIKLRQSNPAFRFKTAEDVAHHLRFIEGTPYGVVAFTLKNPHSNNLTSFTAVAHNVTEHWQTFDLPMDGSWHQVVNDQVAGTETIQIIHGRQVSIAPHSTHVWLLK